MPAGTWNIVAEQGATWQPNPLILRDGAGTLIDLTGYAAELLVKERYDSETNLLQLNTSNGGITLGGAAGTVAPLATATQMADIDVATLTGVPPSRRCVHTLTLTLGATVIRLLQGTFTITRKV